MAVELAARQVRAASQKKSAQVPDRLDDLRKEWIASGRITDFEYLAFVQGVTIIDQLMEREFKRYTSSKFGMSPGDFRILLALRRAKNESARPTDLFRALLVTSGAITKQLDRLEERGLVRRVANAARGRGWVIALTASGRALVDSLKPAEMSPIMHEAFHALGRDERAEVVRALHAIMRQIQNRTRSNPID